MASKEITDYIRTFIAVAGAVVVVAVAGGQVSQNTDDLKVVETDIKAVKVEVHDLQMDGVEMKSIAKGTLTTLTAILAAVENLQDDSNQTKMALALVQKDINSWENQIEDE